jgi:hypothetical protein
VRTIRPPFIPAPTGHRIAFDMCCSSCGYNLRTIEYAGVCPECAQPVATSLRKNKLILTNPARLRQRHKGATILIVAILATALIQGLLFLLWPLLPTRLLAKESYVPEVFTLLFGFGFAAAWFIGVWLLTAPLPSGGGPSRRKARRDNLAKAILVLSLVPFLSTIATIVKVGDAATGVRALPSLDAAVLVAAVAGSVSICLAMLFVLAHLRTIIQREICKGLHLLLSLLITVGAILGGLWTALLFVSEVFAMLFEYPPLSILAGIAAHAAAGRRVVPLSAIAPAGTGGAPSMLPGLIAFGIVNVVVLGGLAALLWALFWFRHLIGKAILANTAQPSETEHGPDSRPAHGGKVAPLNTPPAPKPPPEPS